MKTLTTYILCVVALAAPLQLIAYASPGSAQGYVNDFAHVLSAGDIQSIAAELQSLQRTTGDQVVVATVPSVGDDETIDTYAEKLFQEWGIGTAAHDNGILILVSVGDHEARIEVGYGLEGTVTDLQSGNIIRDVMFPAFRVGDYQAGIAGAVAAVSDIITGSPDADQYLDGATATGTSDGSIWSYVRDNLFILFFLGIVIVNGLARVLGRTRSWWLGGVIGAAIGAVIGSVLGSFSIGLASAAILGLVGLIFDYIVSKHPPGPGSGGSMGGMWPLLFLISRGGGGGGFGGFGGGRSGGGGASGKW